MMMYDLISLTAKATARLAGDPGSIPGSGLFSNIGTWYVPASLKNRRYGPRLGQYPAPIIINLIQEMVKTAPST